MDKTTILETLRAHEAELRAAGILHLRLFGSVARGDVHPESDIDLMADFDKTMSLSILKLVGLQRRLTDLLGVQVDLSSAELLKEHVRVEAVRDAEVAF